MSVQPFPAGRLSRPAIIDRVLSTRIALSWEIAFYAVIFAVALALRFWALGDRALHHDESIHAQWSWRLIQGDYTHSPIFHGPLYYHLQGGVFFLFGSSDYTSRVSAAIFGTAIVALPLLLRRWLGPVGTIAAVAFLAFSPTLVYYSRFFREDIYMAFFVLTMVACMWRYFSDGRDRWLVIFGLAFIGSMLTKEGTFLTVAVFLIFLCAYVGTELAVQTLKARERDNPFSRVLLAGSLTIFAVPIVALWPFLGGARRYFDWSERMPRSGDMLVLLGTFTLPLLTPIVRHPLEALGIVDKNIPLSGGEMTSRLDWDSHLLRNITTNDRLTLGGLFAVTTSAAAFVGMQWRPKLWLVLFAVCAAIYLTLMTSLWTNLDGLVSGPWGSLDYWREQQNEYRGDQPWFYYSMLMPAYEFLPLAVCVAGVWWSVVRGNAFSRFLWVWLIGQWIALSYGSEKMPWLNVHLSVPACILAAWTVQRAWQAWRGAPSGNRIAVPLLSIAGLAAGAMLLVAFLPGGLAYHAIRLAVVAAAAAAVFIAARPFGRAAVPAVLVTVLIGALSLFSVRTMVMASFERGDVPKDLLIYTQSSPDIPDIMRDIEALADATGKGYYLPIAVDGSDSFAWPWAWYLRDYRCVAYPDMGNADIGLSNCEGESQPYQVLLVNRANEAEVTDQLTQPGSALYGSPRRYPHRWWFEESYKSAMAVEDGVSCSGQFGACGPTRLATWTHIADNVFTGSWLETWFFYWRDHDPDKLSGATGDRACNSCGSVDGVAYFPANFDTATGKLSATPIETPRPTADSEGRPVFGGAGLVPGQFLSPVDIGADGAGNVYVIDSATRKLQKFDPQGNLLASVDIRAEPTNAADASQPWGLAVRPDGSVVVADTFGWKIRLFDSELKHLSTFGKAFAGAGTDATPGPYDLFGPRDAAIDAAGNIWVTDTGSDRIVIYTASGEFVRELSNLGDGGVLDEPVGISIASDGAVFVADMFNSRVVQLDGDGAFVSEFPVDGWGSRNVDDKPYLLALADGRIAVGLPRLSEVRIYGRDGVLQGTIDGGAEPLKKPYGMAESADGKLWIVEGGNSRVRQFALP